MNYAIGAVFKRGGFGYLKKQCEAFNNMAKACPVLMLTDLDNRPCAPALVGEWLKRPRHPDFLLRVAVREVEAWLLASNVSLAKFLGLKRDKMTGNPESLSDPKAEFLKMALGSPRRDIRDALVQRDRQGALRQGPAYNSTLADFVTQHWDVPTAAQKCPSLQRLLDSLENLELDWKAR